MVAKHFSVGRSKYAWCRRLHIYLQSTWVFGFETRRTFVAPWENETLVAIIPGIVIGWRWSWIGIPGRDYK